MSEQEFDSYLRLLARFLNLSGSQRTAISRELRAHMEERLDDLLARGYTREDAIHTALDEFGDAAALAGEFGRIGRRRRWIMRTATTTIGIAAAVLLVSFLMPQNRAWVPAPALSHAGEKEIAGPARTDLAPAEQKPDGDSDADRSTRRKLAIVLPDVELPEGATFADAIELLRNVGKVSIDVNWPALALINIEQATDIRGLRLRDIRMETMLTILLDKITMAGGGAGRVGYDLFDGVIRISSQDDLNFRTVVRVYDCSDLLGQPLTTAQKDALKVISDRSRALHSASSSTNRYASSRPAVESDDSPAESVVAEVMAALRDRDADELVKLITRMVEPDTWASAEAGQETGASGAAVVYDGLLVVRNTQSAQRQVAELLGILRQARATRQVQGQALVPTN